MNTQNIINAYHAGISTSDDDGYILDSFIGAEEIGNKTTYETKLDWLYSYLEETAFFDGWPDVAKAYFNLNAYLDDLEIDSFEFIEHKGALYIFSRQ
jgi:hypothetical protein